MEDVAVKAEGISKAYNGHRVLENISFQIEKGEVFGFIGPDGAGKTTLFRILSSLILPEKGEAFVYGLNVVDKYRDVRNITGYVAERFSLYRDLTVEENIRFFATVFGTTLSENYDLIKDVYRNLEPFKNRRAGRLSGGMKQKLALCCALIHRPQILLLDESTTGVDAVSRREFWEMLHKLKAGGMTIALTTSYMDEAAKCDRVALLYNGRIMKTGSPDGIADSFGLDLIQVRSQRLYAVKKELEKLPSAPSVSLFGDSVHVISGEKGLSLEDIEGFLKKRGFEDTQVERSRPGIEDCFLALSRGYKKKGTDGEGY